MSTQHAPSRSIPGMSLTSILRRAMTAPEHIPATLDSATPEGGDFDPEDEWKAMPVIDVEAVALDGDFPGHPFRGNQYLRVPRSRKAVHASMRAKYHETHKASDAKMRYHHSAAHNHHTNALQAFKEINDHPEAFDRSKRYHTIMARFHKERADHHGRQMQARGKHASR